ncbi:Protein TolB [Brevibacillus laterosporus]|nr:Protein TolB [Brevibacillus laterosporus]
MSLDKNHERRKNMQKKGRYSGVLLLIGCLLLAGVSMGGITTEASRFQSSTFVDKQTNESVRKQVLDQQTSGEEIPTRVSKQTFPFYVAMQNEQTVLLWDASKQDSQLIPVATDGKVQIIDWSANKEWIAYLRSPDRKSYSGPWYLWISKADGSKKYQVDSREITGTPKWSPTENMLVYQTREGSREEGIVVRITPNGIERIQTIFQQNEVNEVSDYSWYPDGKSLAVSFPQTQIENLHINQVFLDGTSRTLYRQMTSTITEGIYARDATGLVWSPNGAYLAYFEKPNSGSISADGVPIKVLQIHSQKIFQIGVGLAYPEWLTWSKDSTRLAFINGGDRMATYGKNLRIWEVLNKQVYNKGQTDKVDSLPTFGSKEDAPLLFLRGQEAPWPTEMENHPLVPGQRIWQLNQADQAKPITTGSSATADSSYSLAPTGRQVAYVRLQTPTTGSLFVKDLRTGKEHELLKGVTLSSGYYGSYLPSWIQIAWKR